MALHRPANLVSLVTLLLSLPTTLATPGLHYIQRRIPPIILSHDANNPTILCSTPNCASETLSQVEPISWRPIRTDPGTHSHSYTRRGIQDCTPASTNVSWTAANLMYANMETYTTPAHSNDFSTLNFTLQNSALVGVDTEMCAGMNEEYGFRGENWYKCAREANVMVNVSLSSFSSSLSSSRAEDRVQDRERDRQPLGYIMDPGNNGSALFRYNFETQRLDVNQSWMCFDQDPRFPNFFNGSGTANISYTCKTVTWKNQNWTMGQIYSTKTTTCGPVNVTLSPYEILGWSESGSP